MKSKPTAQTGIVLLEALIGIVVFSIGILAMIALQARAIAVQSDAQYRIEAAKMVSQLVGQIALNVNRGSVAQIQTDLLTFQHQPTTVGVCNYSGAVATSPIVTAWLAAVMVDPGTRITGTAASMLQVQVNTGSFNTVTVTLCWQVPNNPTPHRHTVVSYIN